MAPDTASHAASQSAKADAKPLAIRRVDAIPIAIPLVKPVNMAGVRIEVSYDLLVRVEAASGLVGWGEASVAPTMTGDVLPGMVAAVNEYLAPLVTGKDALKRAELAQVCAHALHHNGGPKCAVDAAIATNAVMGLVEPNYNGIGGDVFAIYYEAKTKKLYGLNAGGWAPTGLTAALIKSKGSTRMPQSGIYTVTVPGAVSTGLTLAIIRWVVERGFSAQAVPSSSASTRPWCRNPRRSLRSWACSTRSRSTPTRPRTRARWRTSRPCTPS